MPNKSVAILLPTYNEEQSIGKSIDQIRELSKSQAQTWRIVLVDSCSTDKTVSIAKEKMIDQIIELPIRGKGIALRKAFEDLNDDYVFQIDCDMTYPIEAIPSMVEKLDSGSCDLVIGSRFRGKMETGAMKSVNKIGNTMLNIIASTLYLHPISDVCSGLWGFNKKAYKSINVTAIHFEVECDMFAEAVKRGLKICEIPIDYRKREGQTKLSIKYGFIDSWHLLKKRF
ncbi:MAG: glycosyltransferase family 2 protein [Candidatus Micrarchaeota archaeon]